MTERSPHDAFKDHEVTRHYGRSLELRNPKDSNLWCTIAMDDGGGIVVFGDFGPIAFSYSDRMNLTQRIAWIGSHEDVDSYVAEKVRHGMSDVSAGLKVATAEHFEADVRAAFEDRRNDIDDIGDVRGRLTWEAFQDDWDWMLGEDDYSPSVAPAARKLDGYMQTLGYDDNWEWIDGLGERFIPQVGYAHAALRRAHLILQAEVSF